MAQALTLNADEDRRSPVGRLAAAAAAALARPLDAEQGRWFLWLPVCFGAGVGVYFALPAEPTLILALGLLMIAAGLRIFLRYSLIAFLAGSVLLAGAAGFACAKLRAHWVAAPIVAKTFRADKVTGWVERWEQTSAKRGRLTLRVISIDAADETARPRRVRLSVNAAQGPAIGEAVSLSAVLSPPPEPVHPGGFDFARLAFFQGIGATGFAIGKLERLEPQPAAPTLLRLSSFIGTVRQAIAARIAAALPESQAPIAQALIMGERALMSEADVEALRAAGVYHVISISGLHMALAAGAAFWTFRLLLALWPWAALRLPVKKWAAFLALAAAFAYLLLSGAAVATQRSFLMVAVMLVAIMIDRPALSLRNVAFAALVILALTPESLLDASFQMSFAATAALVAFYERFGGRFALRPAGGALGSARLAGNFLIGVALTTIVAGLAVAPLSAYHFQNVASYSVLGNMLAMPIVSLVMMPMAMASLLAMPFGLEAWPLAAMGWSIEAMLAVSRWVAGLQGAMVAVPASTVAGILVVSLGGLWLLLWRGRWRYWGLAAMGIGFAVAPLRSPPDILVEREGAVIAIRDAGGVLRLSPGRKGSYSAEQWLRAEGDARKPAEAAKSAHFRCDAASCLAVVEGRLVSLARSPAALAEDCLRADILIAPFPVLRPCPRPRVLIDWRDLRVRGAHAIRFEGGAERVSAVSEARGERPWSRARPSFETIAPAEAAREDAVESQSPGQE